MRRQKTTWYSVFGQIEAAAADAMIEKGRATRIPVAQIPESQLKNERGELAKFAVIVPGQHVAEFEKLCRDLRA